MASPFLWRLVFCVSAVPLLWFALNEAIGRDGRDWLADRLVTLLSAGSVTDVMICGPSRPLWASLGMLLVAPLGGFLLGRRRLVAGALGVLAYVAADLVLKSTQRSLAGGASVPWWLWTQETGYSACEAAFWLLPGLGLARGWPSLMARICPMRPMARAGPPMPPRGRPGSGLKELNWQGRPFSSCQSSCLLVAALVAVAGVVLFPVVARLIHRVGMWP